MSDDYQLFGHGFGESRLFQMMIPRDKPVAILRKLIHKEKQRSFRNVDMHGLVIHKLDGVSSTDVKVCVPPSYLLYIIRFL